MLIGCRVELNGANYKFAGVLVYCVGGVVGGEKGYKQRYVSLYICTLVDANSKQILG